MISLELAKKIKEAGLVWEPKFRDFYYWENQTWVVDIFEQRRTEAEALLWILERGGQPMKAYKINRNLEVVEVECPEGMEFLKLDADGDKIYEKTHYATKAEAREKAVGDCNRWISSLARHIEGLARNRLTDELEGEEGLTNEV